MSLFAAAPGPMLFDFTTAPSPSAWPVVNDDVMGGISTGRFEMTKDGQSHS